MNVDWILLDAGVTELYLLVNFLSGGSINIEKIVLKLPTIT